MSLSSFINFDRTGTTFKTNFQGPSAIFLATLPIGSSPLTSFRQMLCDELLGPTFWCSRFTTSALLGFLQTREPRLQEGSRVEASSTLFRKVLALACPATSEGTVFFPRSDHLQQHLPPSASDGSSAPSPTHISLTRFPQVSGACSQSNHEQKERSFHTPTSKCIGGAFGTHHPCPLV